MTHALKLIIIFHFSLTVILFLSTLPRIATTAVGIADCDRTNSGFSPDDYGLCIPKNYNKLTLPRNSKEPLNVGMDIHVLEVAVRIKFKFSVHAGMDIKILRLFS